MLNLTELIGFGVGGENAHKHWRIYWTAPSTPYDYAQVTEMEMRATHGGADQCNGGTATAYASTGSYTPDKAFDNDSSALTGYSSGTASTGGWLAYQFPVPVPVTEISWASSTIFYKGNPTAFDVQYSDDGLTWITRASFSGLSWGDPETKTFSW